MRGFRSRSACRALATCLGCVVRISILRISILAIALGSAVDAQDAVDASAQARSLAAYDSALSRLEAGDIAKATGALLVATKVDPANVDAKRLLATVFHRQGEHMRASSVLEDLVTREPGDASLLGDLGVSRLLTRDLGGALDAFQAAILRDPRDANAYWQLGEVSLLLGRIDEARTCYLETLELDPEHADACRRLAAIHLSSARLLEAVYLYEKAARLRPDRADFALDHGLALIRGGMFYDAMAALDRVGEECAEFPRSCAAKGSALYSLGFLDLAVAEFWKALTVDADLTEAHLGLARCFLGMNRRELIGKAAFELAEAIRCDAKNPAAYLELAQLWESLGELEKAESTYRALIAGAGFHEPAVAGLGLLLSRSGRADAAEALYKDWLGTRPRAALLRTNLALASYQQGDLARAREEFLIVERAADASPALRRIARSHLESIESIEAREP